MRIRNTLYGGLEKDLEGSQRRTEKSANDGKKRKTPLLQRYFPMLRNREEVLAEIRGNWKLSQVYSG